MIGQRLPVSGKDSAASRNRRSEDTVVVFFSGHGGRVETGPDAGAYLIPCDCNPHDLRNTAIGSEELTTLLSAIKAQRLVVLLDACHSAGVGELKAVAPISDIKAGLDEKTYNALAEGVGRVIIASSRSNEVSLILSGMDNSLFTHYLLEALKGACSIHNDGLVRVFDVFHYISDKVPARAAQHPIFKANEVENNFPLALSSAGNRPGYQCRLLLKQSDPSAHVQRAGEACLQKRLVDRWSELATYFDIPDDDQAKFDRGNEPKQILLWLGQRNRLSKLRDAFNFLGWDDLIEELDSDPI